MAERNDSHLLDGGDSVGMTDNPVSYTHLTLPTIA